MADDHEQEESAGGNSKSERKRQREKKRRSELTNAFEELATIIAMLDGSDISGIRDSAQTERVKGRKRRASTSGDSEVDIAGSNRLELINKAMMIIKKQQRENQELRQNVMELRSERDRNSNEVIVMVPRFVPVGEGQGSSVQQPFPPAHLQRGATYPTAVHPQGMQQRAHYPPWSNPSQPSYDHSFQHPIAQTSRKHDDMDMTARPPDYHPSQQYSSPNAMYHQPSGWTGSGNPPPGGAAGMFPQYGSNEASNSPQPPYISRGGPSTPPSHHFPHTSKPPNYEDHHHYRRHYG